MGMLLSVYYCNSWGLCFNWLPGPGIAAPLLQRWSHPSPKILKEKFLLQPEVSKLFENHTKYSMVSGETLIDYQGTTEILKA